MKTVNSNVWKSISDMEYINGLKGGDSHVTEAFFYGLCNYMLNDIKYSLLQGQVDYDELVNELFIFLSKDNWRKLDTFEGKNGSCLCTWLTRLVWRYFNRQRDRILGKDTCDIDSIRMPKGSDGLDAEMSVDINNTFKSMPNKRYVEVLQLMLVEGYNAEEVAEKLNTSVANIYNIKHRAIVQFVEIYSAC